MKKLFASIEGKTSGGSLTESFPEVIKSVITDEAGFYPGIIPAIALDLNSFSQAGAERGNWKCSAFLDGSYSGKIISKLLKESAMIITSDFAGRKKLIPLEERAAAKTINENDIIIDDNGIPIISFKKSIKMYNSFILKYRFDYFTGNYLETGYLNKSSTSFSTGENERTGSINSYTALCMESFSRYKIESGYFIESEFIREKSTAIKLLKWYADWFALRRLEIDLQCFLNSNTLVLEPGDQIRINSPLLKETVRNTHNFIITGLSCDYFKGKIKLQLQQMSRPE